MQVNLWPSGEIDSSAEKQENHYESHLSSCPQKNQKTNTNATGIPRRTSHRFGRAENFAAVPFVDPPANGYYLL
jgi:hypothetical protein